MWEKWKDLKTSPSVLKAKSITKPGRHGDDLGLYLNVSPSGTKSWVQRIAVDGRRRDIGLGGFPAVSLALARPLSANNRAAVAEGRDPLAERQRAPMPTFRDAAYVNAVGYWWSGWYPMKKPKRPSTIFTYSV